MRVTSIFEDVRVPLVIGNVTPGSGICGAVFNLTTSIIGADIMALPATMKVLGVVLIVLMGILSEISVELLVRLSVHCKAQSYGEVVQSALGRVARILFCDMYYNAGVLVVYLIIMGDVLSGSMRHIGVFDQLLGNGIWDHRKLLILVILVLFLAPLCALDKIDSLTLTSASALNYIVRIGYQLHLILVFPVIHFSLRQTVDAMIFEGSAPLHENRKRCLVLTVVLLGLIYFGSTMIHNIWRAFKFTGATTAVSLGFTFPALIALRLSKEGINLSCGEKFLSWFMLILATIVSIAGIIGNVYSINTQSM